MAWDLWSLKRNFKRVRIKKKCGDERTSGKIFEVFIFLVSWQFKQNNSWLTAMFPRSFWKFCIIYKSIKIRNNLFIKDSLSKNIIDIKIHNLIVTFSFRIQNLKHVTRLCDITRILHRFFTSENMVVSRVKSGDIEARDRVSLREPSFPVRRLSDLNEGRTDQALNRLNQ